MNLKELIHNIKFDLLRYTYGSSDTFTLSLFFKGLAHLGFWAVLNYRIGRYMRLKTKNKIIWAITGLNKIIIEILTGISIPYSCNILSGILIGHFSNIMIAGNVQIGTNCTLHQGVTIGLAGREEKKGVPIIGDDVFVGAGAVILGKIKVGNAVAVGSNAVITDDVPDNAVVVGQKAEIISYKGSKGL
ncbi:serine O-acetyltransferase [Metabacillus halosaccharovorans]|uniref:serine O-acetyltransferase n=1 Tax=Metabacillus halosaccharovorans TaxID=930124 RepID=UPI001C1FCC77|nr:serine acetyltransferase [Metabacillus halosaccharovorans]MBU7594459.1 serine acetyltransferase [Metabacillus halosaccharovorans]